MWKHILTHSLTQAISITGHKSQTRTQLTTGHKSQTRTQLTTGHKSQTRTQLTTGHKSQTRTQLTTGHKSQTRTQLDRSQKPVLCTLCVLCVCVSYPYQVPQDIFLNRIRLAHWQGTRMMMSSALLRCLKCLKKS